MATPPLPRSYLFVPADRPERFGKALASEADMVVIDLEDAVAADRKAVARAAVAAFLADAGAAALSRCAIRINDQTTEWHRQDLAIAGLSAAGALMCPKAEDEAALAAIAAACAGPALLPLVESARGVLAAARLAAAPHVQRLVFGTIDYALDMALEGEWATTIGLDHAAATLATASRAAGIASPVAGVTVAIDDEARLRADFERARAHGFGAKLCIHPRQIAAVHALLAPSDPELAWARRVLAAAEAAGGSAVRLDGQMIDRPVIERARRLLSRTPGGASPASPNHP